MYRNAYTSPSYQDDKGCGGESCTIPFADLSSNKGITEILAGYEEGKDDQFVMIPDVTAIFPSVTLASWASIFTGKMSGTKRDTNGNITYQGTGITGNEYFARI